MTQEQRKRAYRTQPTSKFDKLVGSGAAGVACCVLEWPTPYTSSRKGRGGRGDPRRLVVKRAIGLEAERDLRNETRRNSRDRIWTADYGSLLNDLRGSVPILEYLENGSLGSLLEKLKNADTILPNRVLWSFCLCVVRAFIVHAYLPDGDEDTPNQLERIVSGRQPLFLGHGDIHGHNIAEHNIVPPLKLIDFGRIQESEQEFNRMVFDMWLVMASKSVFSSPHTLFSSNETTIQGLSTMSEIYPGRVTSSRIETRASMCFSKMMGSCIPSHLKHSTRTHYCPEGNGAAYPTLDNRLRYFLARCATVDRALRPSLEHMLAEAETGAAKSAEAYGPHEKLESDAAVERVLVRLLYDAELPMPTPPGLLTNDATGGGLVAADDDAFSTSGTKKRSFPDDELDDGQAKDEKKKKARNDLR
ncbi:hypothetical protein HD806DRAFT_548158 [Xylariaceae sp. AK1471]|nr:hypothetical protein HD806DRAFT_548158 [Xylariaceae sp. AK1471]